MSKKVCLNGDVLVRSKDSVFVNVSAPEPVQQLQQAESYFKDWTGVAVDIAEVREPDNALTESILVGIIENMTALDQQDGAQTGGWHCEGAIFKVARVNLKYNVTSPALRQMLSDLTVRGVLEHKTEHGLNKFRLGSETEPIPSLEELFEAFLPRHIEASRWGIYVIPSKECRVFDGTTFVHVDPHPPFWNLYNLAKGIFSSLGIKLSKSTKGVWIANIPIAVLTDQVFVDSGLAGVEKTLRTRTTDDASIAAKISDGIRHRQFENSKRGYAKVQRMRETLADAAGVVAIVAVSWAGYIIGGTV